LAMTSRLCLVIVFFFSSRRRHTRSKRDWSSDVCSSDLAKVYSDGKWLTYDKINADTEIGNADKALQIVNFNLSNQAGYRLQYRVHSAYIGWQPWVNQGEDAGISGKNIQVIDFKLVRDGSVIITKPSIYYQAHISKDGWLDYVGDSEIAGNIEKSYALEAFKIGIDNISSNYQLNVKTYDK